MPVSAPRPCSHVGCRNLAVAGGRCADHPRDIWVKKPTAAKRITGRRLQAMRAELFQREPLCEECKRQGRVTAATQRDHIESLEEGGEDIVSNTQALCEECHDAKSLAERTRALRKR